MAFMINGKCITCGACEMNCPNSAVSEGEIQCVIDPAKCTECVGFYDEPRCASVCPVDACVPDPGQIESH